ncbi:MAG: DUF1273 domain-containing protein [Ruminococcaceae bacterium]|nr:DUF1273 domain-containing protein [Oscillospiraceae bacterium]
MENKICCFTGHRKIDDEEITKLPSKLDREIEKLYSLGVREFRAGGAIGFDTLAALKVLAFRKTHPDVRLSLILPCRDQDRRWNDYDKRILRYTVECADSVLYIENTYTQDCMHRRNRALVRGADHCIAYVTRNEGGSAYTLNIARREGLTVTNLGDDQLSI